jgi:hypothetical protein
MDAEAILIAATRAKVLRIGHSNVQRRNVALQVVTDIPWDDNTRTDHEVPIFPRARRLILAAFCGQPRRRSSRTGRNRPVAAAAAFALALAPTGLVSEINGLATIFWSGARP